ncbi:MAG: aminoacyl-tRNA hydrolase [Methylovulum sp.]|nr:aminoacyl-tRNA hydrolase [Methylovulum sp.]
MIKLIVGLGNPGRQYEKTRHNAGFLFLDKLLAETGGSWSTEVKFQGLFAEIGVSGGKVLLLKPETFMNRSGQSVGKVARYYKLLPEEILVVHDELDFDVGVMKLKKGGGHAGHNGLRDIIAHMGSNEFYRLRIGIGRPDPGKSVADYVLSAPSKIESQALESVVGERLVFVGQMVSGDMAVVMNKLNA